MSQPPNPALRASDADRESVGEALRRHHTDGRIDTDELQDRISRCYGARTEAELDELLADLPGEPRPHETLRSRSLRLRPRYLILPPLIVVMALGAATHNHHHPLWPALVLAFLATQIARRWVVRRHVT